MSRLLSLSLAVGLLAPACGGAQLNSKPDGFRASDAEMSRQLRKDQPARRVRRLVVPKKIHFHPHRAELSPESFETLDTIADEMRDNPALVVEVRGHTDSVGPAAKNYGLSMQRALRVRQYLTEQQGIHPYRLAAAGRGESTPVTTNRTVEGRAHNRRVEFVIVGENFRMADVPTSALRRHPITKRNPSQPGDRNQDHYRGFYVDYPNYRYVDERGLAYWDSRDYRDYVYYGGYGSPTYKAHAARRRNRTAPARDDWRDYKRALAQDDKDRDVYTREHSDDDGTLAARRD